MHAQTPNQCCQETIQQALQGNCKEPFPSSEFLEVSFPPSFPAQKLNQCLLLLDSSTVPSPAYDVEISANGGMVDDISESDELAELLVRARNTDPIWIDNVVIYSQNKLTDEAILVSRDTVMTNISLAGTETGSKEAIWLGPANGMHMEGKHTICRNPGCTWGGL